MGNFSFALEIPINSETKFYIPGNSLCKSCAQNTQSDRTCSACMDYWCKLNRLAKRSALYSHLTWSKEKNKLNEQTPGSDKKFIGIIERSPL